MTRRTSTAAGVLLMAAVATTSAAAQDAYTYTVRRVERDAMVANPVGALDPSEDPDPMRVVQGPRVTWVVPAGDSLTLQDATLILYDNAPVRPGPGGVMIRGWDSAHVARYDSFSVSLVPAGDDRRVAGRTARHYRLQARIRRTSSLDGSVQTLSTTGQLWVLPDVPHSWAPFGLGTHALTARAPRLRDELDARLAELGLVVRAFIGTRFDVDGPDGESADAWITAFEVSGLEKAQPPRSPGPVIDRAVVEASRQRVMEAPGATCMAVAGGGVPEVLEGVAPGARKAMLAQLNDDCGSSELYFNLFRQRLKDDPGLCATATGADGPEALARAAFNDAQRAAFMEFIQAPDRRRFLAEIQGFCRTRG